jgi:hypothetical protein
LSQLKYIASGKTARDFNKNGKQKQQNMKYSQPLQWEPGKVIQLSTEL